VSVALAAAGESVPLVVAHAASARQPSAMTPELPAVRFPAVEVMSEVAMPAWRRALPAVVGGPAIVLRVVAGAVPAAGAPPAAGAA